MRKIIKLVRVLLVTLYPHVNRVFVIYGAVTHRYFFQGSFLASPRSLVSLLVGIVCLLCKVSTFRFYDAFVLTDYQAIFPTHMVRSLCISACGVV